MLHSAYLELVRNPPVGVVYSWDEGRIGQAGAGRFRLVARIFGLAKLPHMRPLLRTSQPVDLIHSQQALLLTRRPWVVDIEHSMPFVGIDFDRYRYRSTRALIRRVLAGSGCRAIMAWTETARRGFLREFGFDMSIRRKTCVVHPAIRLPVDRHSEVCSGREVHLLFVANRPDHNFVLKGGREVLLAYRMLRFRYPELRLTIVSGGRSLAGGLADQPGVRWLGTAERAELASIYKQADVFVMPSFSDTFGMVYLEAMSFGLPVIALDRPYTQDVVRSGETGLLAPMPRSGISWVDPDGRFLMNSDVFIRRLVEAQPDLAVADGVVRCLERLLVDPSLRRKLGRQAREEVASGRFSLGRRNENLVRIYGRAVRGAVA